MEAPGTTTERPRYCKCGKQCVLVQEDYTYKSLEHTTLVGLDHYNCPDCGRASTIFPCLGLLVSALAKQIALKPYSLGYREIKHIVSHLIPILDEEGLAERLGVSEDEVESWMDAYSWPGPPSTGWPTLEQEAILRRLANPQAPSEWKVEDVVLRRKATFDHRARTWSVEVIGEYTPCELCGETHEYARCYCGAPCPHYCDCGSCEVCGETTEDFMHDKYGEPHSICIGCQEMIEEQEVSEDG